MTPTQLRDYFSTSQLPESYDWHPWAKISNCRNFVDAQLLIISQLKEKPLEKCPAYQHLLDFYNSIISEN